MYLLIIFGCVGSLLLHAGFLQLQRVGGATLRCSARASHCGGFSCCGAWAVGMRASVVVAYELSNCGSRVPERRLSSCGAQAQLLRSMWDLPGPGLEPVSPALAGGFLTTAPPGKPHIFIKEHNFCPHHPHILVSFFSLYFLVFLEILEKALFYRTLLSKS